jgi:hypothetical protein
MDRPDISNREDAQLTVGDVSKLLDGQLTPDGVRHAIDRGELPAVRTASGQRLITRGDAMKFKAKRDARAHQRQHVA